MSDLELKATHEKLLQKFEEVLEEKSEVGCARTWSTRGLEGHSPSQASSATSILVHCGCISSWRGTKLNKCMCNKQLAPIHHH